MAVPVTAILAGVLGLLLVGLAARVSALRMRHQVSLGDGGHPALVRAIRAHGNTVEHAPLFLLIALAYEITEGTDDLLIVTGGVFVLARVLLAAGLLARGLHKLRMLGAAVTYVAQAVLAVALLASVLGAR